MEKKQKSETEVSNISYAEKFRIMDREALATLILAVIIAAFFWGAIWLLKDNTATVFAMPVWFVVSCIGGYLLSMAGVIYLVKKVMVDFPLDEQDTEITQTEQEAHDEITGAGSERN